METQKYGQSLIEFLNDSPCNFFAVETIKKRLEKAGYKNLLASDSWNIKPGDKVYITKNDSAIFAINIGSKPISEDGFKIISAHSDSPCFRIKPNAQINSEGGVVKLNTEVYGGPILYTWFDRPLSVAGRGIVRGGNELSPITKLVNIDRPIVIIPHLPILFNRTVIEGNPLSKHKAMLPVLGIIKTDAETHNDVLSLLSTVINFDF